MSWISRLFGRGRGKTIRTPSTQELEKRIRQSPLFKDVPEENIARMLAESRTIQVRASDAIVLEGGEGQFYFIQFQAARFQVFQENIRLVDLHSHNPSE